MQITNYTASTITKSLSIITQHRSIAFNMIALPAPKGVATSRPPPYGCTAVAHGLFESSEDYISTAGERVHNITLPFRSINMSRRSVLP